MDASKVSTLCDFGRLCADALGATMADVERLHKASDASFPDGGDLRWTTPAADTPWNILGTLRWVCAGRGSTHLPRKSRQAFERLSGDPLYAVWCAAIAICEEEREAVRDCGEAFDVGPADWPRDALAGELRSLFRRARVSLL